MGYLVDFNSIWIWIAAFFGVLVAVLQAGIILKKSFDSGKKMGLSSAKLKKALKTGVISAIGPSIPILVGAITLVVIIGAPITWSRLGHIGSVMYELMVAGFASQALGVDLGGSGFGGQAASTAAWVMALGSFGWIAFVGVFTPHLDKVRNRLAGGREALLPIITSGAMLGAFSYFVGDNVLAGGGELAAVVTGAGCMIGIRKFADKYGLDWLPPWALGMSMFAGMIVAFVIFGV